MKPSRPSATSLLIAKGTIYLGGHPEYAPLVPLEAEAISESILKTWAPWTYRMIAAFRQHRWFQSLIQGLEAMTVPGMLLHYQLRKRQIETWLHRIQHRDAIERLVVLGAGMDTLAYRWALEFPACQVIEVDHPDTQAAKVFGLKDRAIPKDMHFVAADLSRESWASVSQKFPVTTQSHPHTVVVAEGLFMYLPLSEVQTILRESAKDNCLAVIFSFMDINAEGKPAFCSQEDATDRWLQRQGESFVWGSSLETMRQRLQHLGMNLQEKAEAKDLQSRFKYLVRASLASAKGEILVLARPNN